MVNILISKYKVMCIDHITIRHFSLSKVSCAAAATCVSRYQRRLLLRPYLKRRRGVICTFTWSRITDSKTEANETGQAQNEIVSDICLSSSIGSDQELKAKGPVFESRSDFFFSFIFFFSFCPPCDNKGKEMKKNIYYKLITFFGKCLNHEMRHCIKYLNRKGIEVSS